MNCCRKRNNSSPDRIKKSGSPSKENLVNGGNNNSKASNETAHLNKGYVNGQTNQSDKNSKAKSKSSKDIHLDNIVLSDNSALQELQLDPKMSADLSNLISRLEAVTTRLEATAGGGGGGASQSSAAPGELNLCTFQ